MNILFSLIFILSTLLLLCVSPENFLSALLDGAGKSAALCASLIATYAVWLGLMRVWEDSGVTRGISRLLRPIAKKAFKTEDGAALDAICMNLSVNLLGISGAATPYGIQAANLLDKTEQAEYSSALFFVLNATSIQLLPTSLVAVRVAFHSAAPNDIILPVILTSLFSTLFGVLFTKLFFSLKEKKHRIPARHIFIKKRKTKGAGI